MVFIHQLAISLTEPPHHNPQVSPNVQAILIFLREKKLPSLSKYL